ncbi:MAG: aminoacyl-tRNA hydrolase [Actinomycetota bacterium]|nr:aminoacyl-tRNA hydrolase [Actinomycetota bacterium]
MSGIKINRSLTVPDQEIEFRFTTSGGPGGQHANKASTRVELIWNVSRSAVLGPRQRQRLLHGLRHRVDASGNLRLASDRNRSQMQNRNEAIERFRTLVSAALIPPKKRVETKPTKAAREKRLIEKKQRSEVKQKRKVRLDDF